jgi:hypothetical protein
MPNKYTPRQAALGFASMGFSVFPVYGIDDKLNCTCGKAACKDAGKHPFTRLAPHGLKDAHTDLDKIKTWPASVNYAIASDPFIIVDVDPRHHGDKTWRELSRKTTRHIPYTWQVRTGGGGEHIYFRNTADVKCGKLGKGVDIKAIGGYVVGPYSKHASGKTYQWTPGCAPPAAPLADPPQWLLDEMSSTQPSASGERLPSDHWDELFNDFVADGGRNDALKTISGHLFGCGVDPVVALMALKGINAIWMAPPEDDDVVYRHWQWTFNQECKKRGLK